VWLLCDSAPERRVRALGDLQGSVRIGTAEQALEFVRLFSTEGRWRFSGVADYVEPVPGDRDVAACFVVARHRYGHLPRIATSQAGDDPKGTGPFVVRRLLVDQEYKVYDATERVARDGGYMIETVPVTGLDGGALGAFLLLDR